MYTVANGIILKGIDLIPCRENIVVDDGKIIEIAKDVFEGKIIDISNNIVCPSFINAHTHIGDSFIPDLGYSLPINDVVKPPNGIKHVALNEVEDEDIINGMVRAMKEMIDCGTTHFIDYREGGIKGIKLLKEASKDLPITPIILGRDDSLYGDDIKKAKIAIGKILKIADGIAPSGFGEINDEIANLISTECAKKGKISSIHVGENKEAQINSLKKFNKSEIERATLNNFNQLVHCTNPINNDLDLIFNQNTVICPRANSTLNVGTPPFELIKNSLIGTDNVMLNSPNMFRELEFTMKLMIACYGKYPNPIDILKLATTNVNSQTLNNIINKSVIDINQNAEFFIVPKISNDFYLNIINRIVSKDLIYIINKNYYII